MLDEERVLKTVFAAGRSSVMESGDLFLGVVVMVVVLLVVEAFD